MKRNKIKTLQNKAEKLWKEVCYARDGKRCQVRENFPFIPIAHSKIYQVDHCITRKNKRLFLDPANGTVVCSSCNQAKSFNLKSIHRAIDEIVIRREGEEKFKTMVSLDQAHLLNENWRSIGWLEEQIEYLTKRLQLEKNPVE